jgi:redox-sensitive bicupin YhaK (pirin superfamily)
MALSLRAAQARGHADHGWLDSRHTFSFAHYFDVAHMGFRALRVINEDIVKPGGGFATHGHANMEIISYVLNGGLEHRDTTGAHGVLRPGDVQYMSAGTGVRHSEFNASDAEDVHFLQIWILPKEDGHVPAYFQSHFSAESRHNQLKLVAAPDGADEVLPLRQDVRLYASLLDAGTAVAHDLAPGHAAWIQVAGGTLTVNGLDVAAGDGVAIEDETRVDIKARAAAEFLLFDLA